MDRLKRRADLAGAVHAALEGEERSRKERLAQKPTVLARLAQSLNLSMKPQVLLKSWDTNVDGVVSRIEFRQHVCELVPGADYREVRLDGV